MTHFGKFSHKFGTAIKHNLLWKWVRVNLVFSVISAISAAILLGICTILNNPMAGLIIVRYHNLSGFLPFRGIVYGPMRSTHRVSQGFVSACYHDIAKAQETDAKLQKKLVSHKDYTLDNFSWGRQRPSSNILK